jgi:hypothetical protein
MFVGQFFLMADISINIALARMEQTTTQEGEPVLFSIEFIKADGSLRKMKAQKHVKFPENAKGKFRYNLKSKGALLLFDTDIKEYRAVSIDSIIKYNDFNVIH